MKDFRHRWLPGGYVFALLSLIISLNTSTTLAAPVQRGTSPTQTTHMMGYWKFDEGSGSIALDSSGHHRDGAISGAVYSTDHAPVKGSTYSLSFDGVQNLVSVPDSSGLDFSATDQMTISLWFNLSSLPGIWHAIGKRAGCDLTSINYQLAYDSRGLLFDSGGNIVATGITNIPTGVWMHFAVTYNPTLQKLVIYVNGKKATSQTNYMLSAKNTAPLLIAESGTCGYTFPGNLDEVCILRQTLSASQVAELAGGRPCNKVS
ncbi:MAG: LamG domain-containing protein [Ktedonobacteraceae bacterium]